MKRICKILLLAGSLLCLAGCGTNEAVREQQMKLRSEGMEKALSGDYDGAIASYDKALELADIRAGALERDIAAYKASAQYHNGDVQGAIDTCTSILDLKKSAEIYLTRGLLYREAENTQAANADFAAAMKLTSSRDRIMQGRLSYYMEDYAGAKEHLEAADKAGNKEASYWLGELYWEMGNKDYALTLYQTYLQGESAHQGAYAKVAAYQVNQGDYDDALKTLEDGIALGDSGSLKALLASEIAVYEWKGDYAEARTKMESYLEKYPEDEKAAREYEFLKSR